MTLPKRRLRSGRHTRSFCYASVIAWLLVSEKLGVKLHIISSTGIRCPRIREGDGDFCARSQRTDQSSTGKSPYLRFNIKSLYVGPEIFNLSFCRLRFSTNPTTGE